MLAVAVALAAVLTPYFSPWVAAFNGLDHYVVDLGYQLNQGETVSVKVPRLFCRTLYSNLVAEPELTTYFSYESQNNTLVTFRNVRYAAAPVGPSRFLVPTAPSANRTGIQNAGDVICPQAFPGWLLTGTTDPITPGEIPPVDPRTSEDCLFLDVLLPKGIWEKRKRSRAAVLVWIHGGGFDIGWKDASGRGYGLVTRSQQLGSQGVILVSIGYRLGLFGWMHGAGVTSNAGLLDQRFALEWVQKYIHLFGGDPSRVTILGESAGGSAVEAHVTAYGGSEGRSPFRGAIAQSPYFIPSFPLPNSRVNAVLAFGNVASVDALRQTSSAALQRLNALLIGNSRPFGTFTFGIVPDGGYVPDLPGKLFKQGRFDRTLSAMTGHNQDEGSRFVPNTLLTNESSYEAYLQSLITPLANDATALNQITQVLYPPVFDGSQGYTNQVERNNLTIADGLLVCNARFIDQAVFFSPTYAYEWSVPPAVHGADLAYTFYDFGLVAGVNTTVAEIMQRYITRFAEVGNPNAPTLPFFPAARLAGGRAVQNLGSDFVGAMLDERGIQRLPERCHFWQDPPYLSSSSDGGSDK